MNETKPMQKLDVCRKNGVAEHWTANLFKCSEKSPCLNKRDFGGQKYCTDYEKPMPLKTQSPNSAEFSEGGLSR